MVRLLNLLRGRRERLERDLARELDYHVDRRVEELTRTGLSEPEARRQARLELGGVPQVQEAVRDAWVWRWLDVLVRDVRYAARSLTTNWGFALDVVAYLVGHRMRELAVRRVLGAGAADVMRLIVSQGLRLVGAGLVLGLAGALAVARLLTGLLYEIGPWDAGTYLGTIAVVGVAGLLATLLPATRAATIAPAIVLQQE